MKTRDNARYDFQHCLKTAASMGAAVAVILFFFSTLPALSVSNYKMYGYAHVFFSGAGTCINIPNVFLIISGMFAALVQFRFLGSRRMTSVVFSYGLSRARLYFNRCAVSAVSLFMGVLLPLTGTLCLNVYAFGFRSDIFKTYLLFLVSTFAFVCIGFCAGLIGTILTGKTTQAAVSATVLVLLPSALMLYVFASFFVFLRGCDFLGNMMEHAAFADVYYLNPLYLLRGTTDPGVLPENVWSAFSVVESNTPLEFGFSRYAPFFGWVFFCALLSVAVYPLFLRRKAELSGQSRGSKGVYILLVGLLMTLVSAAVSVAGMLIMVTIDYNGVLGRIILLMLGLVSALIIMLICLRIITRDRQRFRRHLRLVPLVLLLALVPLICLAGGFGYAGRTPNIEDIQSIYIDGLLLPKDTVLYEWKHKELLTRYLTNGFVSSSDKQKIIALQKLLAKDDNESELNVTIKYILKDGGNFYRSYSSCSDEALKALAGLFDSDAAEKYLYDQLGDKSAWMSTKETDALEIQMSGSGNYVHFLRARQIPFLKYNSYKSISLCPVDNRSRTVITEALTEETFYTLMNCYATDLVGLSADEYYTPDTPLAGVLSIESFDKDTVHEGQYIFRNYYITASMTKTLAYLKQLGIDGALSAETQIAEIKLYKCPRGVFIEQEPYLDSEELNSIAATHKYLETITDPAEIKELSEKLYPYYLTVGQEYKYALVTYEDGGVMAFVVKE